MAYSKKRSGGRGRTVRSGVRRKSVGGKTRSRRSTGSARQQTVRVVIEAVPAGAGGQPSGAMTVPMTAPRKGRF